MRRATQRDIAAVSGFSVMTVCNALRGTGKMSARSRQRILATASKLGYRPGQMVHGLRDGSVGAFAFLSHPLEFQPPQLLMGVTQAARARNHRLFYGLVPHQDTLQDTLPDLIRDLSVDGALMLLCYDVQSRVLEEVEERKLPLVWLNSDNPCNSVIFPERQMTAAATRACLVRGHRRIAYVGSLAGNHIHYLRERRAGYLEAMAEAGLPGRLSLPESTRSWLPGNDELMRQLRTLLTSAERPTALVTFNGELVPVACAVAAGLGLRIPQDLSLTTIHPSALASAGIPITTWVQPWAEMGDLGVALLSDLIRNQGRALPSRVVPYRPPEGDSIHPVPPA